MSSTFNPRSNRAFRPGAHRTLSSSLRLYTNPLLPRQARRAQTVPLNGSLSPTHEANEHDDLLGTSPRSNYNSVVSFRTGSIGGTDYGNEDEDDEDIEDLEAEVSEEQADSDGLYPPNCAWTTNTLTPPKRSDPFGVRECDIYGNIHRVRHDIINSIDDPYSIDQLKAPRMNISVVRPLVEKFYAKQDLSIVFCILVNRAQFIREQSYAAHHQTVNLTRALLCELLAEKVLRKYNEFNPGPRGLLKLANILVASFDAFQGMPDEVLKDSFMAAQFAHRLSKGRQHAHKLTALEVAIVSESKSFLASTACQKVVDAIYRGKVVYTPSSYIDIIPDHWKKRPISLYDPRRAPVLNQYRLVVPRTRNWIEVMQFAVLLGLYIGVMVQRETREKTTYGAVEIIFDIYACGWILDQLASILEHGWHVYTQNLWAFLDVLFSTLFLIYLPLRLHGRLHNDPNNDALGITALDVLSCAAPILIPRLAFNIMSENMLFLSLRAMMGDFITLTALAIWCFAGFLLALKWLHNGIHDSLTISKWMIFVWFGLDGTGISEAPSFHRYLGPVLMVTFAFLGNTLFLTILVSMLSNTFSVISANAVQEIQYRRAVLTFLGVKSDAVFAFIPPFNLGALAIFGPLKFILTPRMFHSVFVFTVRCVNLPQLVILSWYERNTLWVSSQFRHIRPRRIDWKYQGGPRAVATGWWSQTLMFWDFSKFSAQGDIQAVFASEPPDHVLHETDPNADNNNDEPYGGSRGFDEYADLDNKSVISGRDLRERVHAQFRMPLFTATASSHARLDSVSAPHLPVHSTTAITTDESGPGTPVTPRNRHSPRLSAKANRSLRKRMNKRTRLSTIDSDAALRAEFHDSEEEAEAANRRKSHAVNLKRSQNNSKTPNSPANGKNSQSSPIKRVKRKDSMIDYDHGEIGAIEANARLNSLQKRLDRIESLLVRVVTAAEAAHDADIEENEDLTTGSTAVKTRTGTARGTVMGLNLDGVDKIDTDVDEGDGLFANGGGAVDMDDDDDLRMDDGAGSPGDAEVETAVRRNFVHGPGGI